MFTSSSQLLGVDKGPQTDYFGFETISFGCWGEKLWPLEFFGESGSSAAVCIAGDGGDPVGVSGYKSWAWVGLGCGSGRV